MTATISDVKAEAVSWLLSQRDPESGGWGQQHGQDPNTLNTAESVLALVDNGACQAGDDVIVQARQYLLSRQDPGSGAWTRRVIHFGQVLEIPDPLRTAIVVRALRAAGVGLADDSVQRAVRWLDQSKQESAWGHDAHNQPSILVTAHVLLALISLAEGAARQQRGDLVADLIEPGFSWLMQQRNADGSFGDDVELIAGHTLYSVMVLQAVRRAGPMAVPAMEKGEESALTWLRQHQREALDLVEESVRLDLAMPEHDYPFLYMTDALIVQVMYASAGSDDAQSEVARRAMFEVWKRRIPGKGFLGNRLFTWSTAKCLSSLNGTSASGVTQFPTEFPDAESSLAPRKPASDAQRTLRIFAGFAGAIWLTAVALALLDKLTSLVAGLGLTIMLAMMVATDFLSRDAFERILSHGQNSAGSAPALPNRVP